MAGWVKALQILIKVIGPFSLLVPIRVILVDAVASFDITIYTSYYQFSDLLYE